VISLCILSLLAPASISAAEESSRHCGGHGAIKAEDLPRRNPRSECDLEGRIIVDHGIGVEVPPPGRFIAMSGFGAEGSQSLLVTTETDGTVVLDAVGNETEAAGQAPGGTSGSGNECTTNYYVDRGYRETDEVNWWFRSNTTPSGLSISAVATDLTGGYNNWATMRNACGFSDTTNVRNRYNGDRDHPTRIDADGTCTAADGVNMVDFGVLPMDRFIAANCTYGTSDGQADESDIKFNNQYAWFTGSIPSGCTNNRYSIEAVMTHEAGHTYGLGDVSGSDLITMYNRGIPCSRRAVTLAYGDWNLLDRKY
jgi:hypothetical protein